MTFGESICLFANNCVLLSVDDSKRQNRLGLLLSSIYIFIWARFRLPESKCRTKFAKFTFNQSFVDMLGCLFLTFKQRLHTILFGV